MTANDKPFRTASAEPSAAPAARGAKRTLGEILVAAGRLDPNAAGKIAAYQRKGGQSFGQAGISLGLLTRADVDLALARQFDAPYLLQGESALSSELVLAFAPFGAQAEALRALRGQLQRCWFAQPGQHALAVTSTHAQEGRSFLAANLALGFAQLGQRTLLVDADMRQPRQHALFGLSNRAGLSALLTGRAGSEAIRSIPELGGLSVLVAGSAPPNPADLLARPAFAQLLRALAPHYDVVMIDTPAAHGRVDALAVATSARAALVVARQNASPLGALSEFSSSMSNSGVNVLGAVLNKF